MNAFQPMHLIILGIIALLVFGPKKLPELARGIGEAMKEFKKTMHSVDEPEPSAPVVAQVSPTPEVTEAKPPAEAGVKPPVEAGANSGTAAHPQS
jgi:sec-independent protein translocase protein TatA